MSATSSQDSIVEEITIRSSAARIFDALIDPAERLKWWGTEGRFQTTHMESDPRPGGTWSMRGIGIGGKPFTVRGKYLEIDRPRILAFTWLPDWQPDATETQVRFELEERDGVTRVRLIHSGLTPRDRESHKGWPQILGWLQTYATEAGLAAG